MVTRKPVPSISTSTTSQAKAVSNNALPYPTTPVLDPTKSTASSNEIYSPNLSTSPAFELVDREEAKAAQRARSDSDSSHGTWDSDDTTGERDHETPEDARVPKPLNIRASQELSRDTAVKKQEQGMLPNSLRIGGQQSAKSTEGRRYEEEAQSNPWADGTSARSSTSARLDSNNPYLQRDGFIMDSSQSEWQEVKVPPVPSAAPPPLPPGAPPQPPTVTQASPIELSAVKSPTEDLRQMSLHEQRPASWETAEILSVPQQGQAPLPPVTSQSQHQSQDLQRPPSTWWQDSTPGQSDGCVQSSAPPYPIEEDGEELPYRPPPGPPPTYKGSLLDLEEETPEPPPRAPVPAPINTVQPSASQSNSSVPETPGTQLKKQRNQTYQIKHINWFDASYTQDPRMKTAMRYSPILTQNANGPCPLLALVNALVLSTPSTLNTPLVETLRTREQVSLGLLLDAVFDELMSGRRGDTTEHLPDVGDLYSFLLALHTGMNVNPRFVTPITTPRGSYDGHPAAMNSFHPMHRAQRKAGAFEETREMRLYSTFNMPLIHGWTAPADSPAYEAFIRSAQTFEDAQNIQFAELELEEKLRTEGLTPQEQQTLHDIQTIKAFLHTWPTQLTDFGLQTIAESLSPGQFAILFRNDHFSTIYKEPKHGALMTLVTDAGYSSHDEIAWESLVDVTGAASEMFSGDFRVVSHGQDVALNQGSSGGGEEGWHTIAGSSPRRYHGRESSGGPSKVVNEIPPPLPGPRPSEKVASAIPQREGARDAPDSSADAQRKAAEQEDHDLALALQLQEEEEDHQRQADDRRRRERELSEQFLSNESTEGPRPAVPPRRGGGRAGAGPTTAAGSRAGGNPQARPANTRPAVSRPADDPADPEAPPSYEQAASDPPYHPTGSTAPANLSQGNPLGAYDALRRQQSAYNQTSSAIGGNAPQTPGMPGSPQWRRRSDATRLGGRRQSSMGGLPAMPGAYGSSPTGAPSGAPGPHQRVGQAAGVKEAEERCCIM